uniref:Uncharacterized protein n=1 Tax=Arundo donax TaxID=35708 RepID=A0A0A8ZY88_ARUDO
MLAITTNQLVLVAKGTVRTSFHGTERHAEHSCTRCLPQIARIRTAEQHARGR